MAGIETVGQCEWADYQTKVLEKHWPDVPRWRDIRTLTKESFYERTGLRTVDIVSGGFPCQPFSIAGKHGGKDDDRYLWPEMLRVIRELRPTWVLGENVPGIVNLALDTVLSDLENEGYSGQAFIIPAAGIDAPHKRDRVCIVAYANNRSAICGREQDIRRLETDGAERNDNGGGEAVVCSGEWREDESGISGMADGIPESIYRTDTDPNIQYIQGMQTHKICGGGYIQESTPRISGIQSPWENWLPEPGLDRVVDGVPNRLDRIKCLGNAVVPQQFYIFFKLIADIENGRELHEQVAR